VNPASHSHDRLVGSTVPSELRKDVVYRVERRLGDGATATAFVATRFGPEGTSPVVLKIIQPSVVAHAGDKARIAVQKEAVALGRLNERVPPCPFIVRLLDTGSVRFPLVNDVMELPWLALEYVHGGPEGTTLEDRVRHSIGTSKVGFGPERALLFLDQVTEGLLEIHAAGVIHRDLNPNNVLCCGSGASEMFKISDFGVARPLGMDATFGAAGIGTPGYIAPEQMQGDESDVGYTSDIFSLSALLFFVLTGEDLFQVTGFMSLLANPNRRSLASAVGLADEIRHDAEVVAALDRALSQATSPNPADRPQSAKAFAASIRPWLTSCPPTRRTSLPFGSMPAPAQPSWVFSMRHPPDPRAVLVRLGWDSDGHCLAASTEGLRYFDGTQWSDVPSQSLGGIRPVRFVSSAGTGRWLIGGDGMVVGEYSRAGVTRLVRGDDATLSVLAASGDLADLGAAIAERPGSPPLLLGITGGRFLKPLPIPEAASLTAVTRFDETRWLVVGRGSNGRGYAGLYSPLRWELERLSQVEARALVSAASYPEREIALAAGSQGAVLRRERSHVTVEYLPEPTDLAACAVDVLGRSWVGGTGCLWMRSSAEGGWVKAWSGSEWRAPFVSIFADAGFLLAATAEGAILEGRGDPRASLSPWSGGGSSR
jgi:serine/threonine protein kinase